MEGAAGSKEFAEQVGIPQSVAREYVNADKHDSDWKKRTRVKKANDMAMTPELYDLVHRQK